MGSFANAISAGMKAMRNVAGESVTYTVLATAEEISLAAIHQAKKYEAMHQSGAVETIRMDDWLILEADLVTESDELIEPAIGDQIERTLGGFVETFTVSQLPGLNCHEPSGDGRFRVHTKLTSKEAAA